LTVDASKSATEDGRTRSPFPLLPVLPVPDDTKNIKIPSDAIQSFVADDTDFLRRLNIQLLAGLEESLLLASIPTALVSMGFGVICVLLVSCSSLFSSVSTAQPLNIGTGMSQSSAQTQNNQGQMLPITAQVTIAGEVIQLEVAQTPQQQALGLMYRTALADDRGMLFPFERPRIVGFWMKNCKIPLDMIFLASGIVQAIQVNAPPCQDESCPTYGPDVLVEQVIELRGGRSQELGVKVGDRIPIQFLDSQR